MIDLLIAAALLQAPAAPQWQFLERTGSAAFYYDDRTLRRDGRAFEISARVVFDADREGGLRAANSLFRFDCERRTVAMLRLATFDAAGRQMADEALTGEQAAPEPVPANTPQESMLTRFCPR